MSIKNSVQCTQVLLILLMGNIPSAGATSSFSQYIEGRLSRQGLRYQRDTVLTAAARRHSHALAELGGKAVAGTDAHLRHVLHRLGVADVTVRAFSTTMRGKAARQALALRAIRMLREGATHLGWGRARYRGVTVAMVVSVVRRVALRRRGGSLCARPIKRAARVNLYLTTPGGQVKRLPTTRKGASICGQIPQSPPGRYQLEVMLDTAQGPQVAALLPIYRGIKAPKTPTAKLFPQTAQSPLEVESLLFELLNATRRRYGRPPLTPSTELSIVARSHSGDMQRRGFFGHVSPEHGSLAQRLASEGIATRTAHENLAIARSGRRAHDSLMQSPSHRRTLLDPTVTHVGIGVSQDRATGLYYSATIVASRPR